MVKVSLSNRHSLMMMMMKAWRTASSVVCRNTESKDFIVCRHHVTECNVVSADVTDQLGFTHERSVTSHTLCFCTVVPNHRPVGC